MSVCAGDARVHNPEKVAGQQSQLQRQHSSDSSAAASAVAAAITPAAESSVSSGDVSAQSSLTAVSLMQPEQAVGEAQSMTSTGDAGPRVQGPPVDRTPQAVSAIQAVLPASDANFQQRYAAASQPLGSSSASAEIVVPQVQGSAVVHSSAALDSNHICLVEDDRQSMTDSQAHASAEEVASRVQDATADVSAQLPGRVTVAHAALANSPAVNAESAPADAASAEAAAAAEARMASDAAMASWLQDEEDYMSAWSDSELLQSVQSSSAVQAQSDTPQSDLKLRPIGISYQASSVLSYEEQMYQQATDASLEDYECVGEKAPMEIRAGADKDSPWGRLPCKFSDVRAIKGDENNVAWLCV